MWVVTGQYAKIYEYLHLYYSSGHNMTANLCYIIERIVLLEISFEVSLQSLTILLSRSLQACLHKPAFLCFPIQTF